MKKVTTRRRTAINSSISKKNKVCICVPVPKNGFINTKNSHFCLTNMINYHYDTATIYSSIPEEGRNILIDNFLYRDFSYTHLFFLDADTAPENEHAIEKLLSLNKPVVAGVTPIFLPERKQFVWNVKREGEKDYIALDELPKKPFKAASVGGTTILIKREVLSKLPKPYQFTLRNQETRQVEMGEDIVFCNRIKELGFDIWINPSVQCHHYNNVDLLGISKSAV